MSSEKTAGFCAACANKPLSDEFAVFSSREISRGAEVVAVADSATGHAPMRTSVSSTENLGDCRQI